YVFKGTEYILIELALASPWDDSLVYGPKTIVDDWISLRHVGFTTIDSILPHPTNPNQTYVFSGQRYYTSFAFAPNANDQGITYSEAHTGAGIDKDWAALRDVGFASVDMVIPVPGYGTKDDSEQVYVFKGTQYILIKIVNHADTLVYGPKTTFVEWKSLIKAGFTTIDSILPHPTEPNQMYVFSGKHYVLIEFPSKPGAGDDILVDGPKDIASDWPILQE
ncbi:predicted protein, partial [Postia placenta Mad-698-R]